MKKMALALLVTASALAVLGGHAMSQTKVEPGACPVVSPIELLWVSTVDRAVGVEISHPLSYVEHHWESPTDSSRATFSLWRDAVNTIDFNGIGGINITYPSPCLLRTKSGAFEIGLQRSYRTMPSGRDTVYFIGRGTLTPPDKDSVVVEISAEDSTEMLKELAMLRTIRFVK